MALKAPLFRGSTGGLLAYRSASNMDLRDGTIKPSPRVLRKRTVQNGHLGNPAPTIVRWAYNTFACPWFAVYDRLMVWNNGSEYAAAAVGGPATDICEFEDGSGGAALIFCYGNADYIDRVSSTPAATASTDVKLVFATMAGPDLYGITNAGAFSTYKVSKCPSGSDPKTAANWGLGYSVGSPLYPANSLRSFNGAPFVGKPEGLFVLNQTGDNYINRFKWLSKTPHTNNCKGMFEAKMGVVVPLADGSLWLTDGYNQTDISPRKYSVYHRDTPWLRSRITAGCDTGEWTLVATAPWEQGWTAGHGLTVYKCVADAYTDITTNLIDGNPSTTASIETMGDGVTDYLYFGADVPFEGVNIIMGTVATAGSTASTGPQYYGSGGWTTIKGTPDYLYRNDFKNSVYFAKSGFTFWRNFYTAHSSMTKTTNGDTLPSKYWVRFPVGVVPVSAGATIAEVQILPSRPPISDDAALAYTGPDAAGRFSHILAGRDGQNGWEWHDLFAIPVDSEIVAMAMVECDTAQTEENVGPRLMMVGQHSRFYALMGLTDNPSSPVNENYADGNLGTPVVYFMPTELSDSESDRATKQKTVSAFDVYGEYVNTSDTLTMLCRTDHNPWDVAGYASTAPSHITGGTGSEGLVLETALAYEDPNATEIAGPRVTRVDVEFETASGDFDAHPQGNAVTPEIE